MEVTALKKYIHEENKIEYILEQLGCHNIKHNESKGYYSAAHKDGDNPSGVVISDNQYLNYISYSRNVQYEDCQDLISLVEYTNKCSFVEAVKWLHKTLGIEYTPYKKQQKEDDKPDPLAVFKKVCGKKKHSCKEEPQYIDEDAIEDYVPLLHIDWFRDGIMPYTRDKFDICYSYRHNRVVIPHRHWANGMLLGTNQRTVVENYEELGIKKYYLTKGMDKSINLYGLWENYDEIQEAGYVVVYEGERSVLRRDSFKDGTGVALSGKTMSEEQRRILIGLNVEIIIALDNDVPEVDVWHMCEKFYGIRSVSYIKDSHNLLGAKDSPADAKNKVFKFLMKYRTVYDKEKHNEYLKSLER